MKEHTQHNNQSKPIHERLGIGSVRGEINSRNITFTRNYVEEKIASDKIFKKKLFDVLKKYNIDAVETKSKTGVFSFLFDIGDGQVLHISAMNYDKNHKRENAPEILQPLKILNKDKELKIEILPKVKTDGVRQHHAYTLISSLAKQGLIFADCKLANIGLIQVAGKDIPVVIGDGSVIKMKEGCGTEINIDLFYNRLNQLGFMDVPELWEHHVINFFKTNNAYTKYPWVHPETGKWAQDQYIEDNGLKKGEIKGITPREAIEEIRARDLSPLAKELMDVVAEHSLRDKDARAVAAGIIHENWGNKLNKEELVSHVAKIQADSASGKLSL